MFEADYYWCTECETTFPSSELEFVLVKAETREEPAEYVERCPNCGSVEPDLEEAFYCEYCNEAYHSYKFCEVDGMCQGCFDTSVKKLRKFVEAHGDKADNAVLSFLLDF